MHTIVWSRFVRAPFLLALFLFLTVLLAACTDTAAGDDRELTVFAASSLTDAFQELAERYEAEHPGVAVRLNLGASSQLATQLMEGAPADLFASANMEQMQLLVDAGQVAPDAPTRFASNHLVLIVPANNPAAIDSLQALAEPGVKLVTTNPAVPIGRYTRQALAAMDESGEFPEGFEAAVLRNIVSEEANVRQVVTKVQLGEADAAIVYASDVTPNERGALERIPIPDRYNVRASYPIAPLTNVRNPDLAADFIEFVCSDEGEAILAEWGFMPP
ncbi:MAG: molybdate ABC transporter substrate-binding protein [Chloroflexota bacterium]|nr:molybdate ABC transporter substrate-binding protein [Chloroflexota bacterium]